MTSTTKSNHTAPHSASFRDPAGFIFEKDGILFRQVNSAGGAGYDLLLNSGLYDNLVKENLLIPHTESNQKPTGAHAVIQPQQVPFITYPFEWSFSQLRDAALLTLLIQKKALAHGMSLKDASAYNVQFVAGKPMFIDTLSFEQYQNDTPWKAYRQFCEHFLAPLALMAYVNPSLLQLLRVHLDGVPLQLTSKLLPHRARLRPGLLMHVFLHAQAQTTKASEHKQQQITVQKTALLAILGNLERTITRMRPIKVATEWGDYYNKTNYTTDAADEKARLIRSFVRPLKAKTTLDLGGNNGRYSRVLNKLGIFTVCSDIDPNAVEANYNFTKQHHGQTMLPIAVDLINPGGDIGWANHERSTIDQRLNTDIVMALALIHHLAISNNIPLENLAEYFSRFAPHLIIEFVPKSDSQVKKLLSTREDIFPDYHEEGFKKAFSQYYIPVKERSIKGTKRTLFLFKRK